MMSLHVNNSELNVVFIKMLSKGTISQRNYSSWWFYCMHKYCDVNDNQTVIFVVLINVNTPVVHNNIYTCSVIQL